MEGYGLYWYCLELIAQTVEKHNLTFELEHDAELIGLDTNIHQERVQEMMSDFIKWKLFENTDGVVTCLKMASRTDEYTQQLMRSQNKLPTPSLESPENLGGKVRGIRTEEKRTEEKKVSSSSEDQVVANVILADLRAMNPKHSADINVWAKTIRLMRERDGRTHEEILNLWRWANKHDFWSTNILSPEKLRKQWDQLFIQRKSSTKTTRNEFQGAI